MKTHLNLATTDLEKSIAFYSTLLDARPAKVRDNYALFITDRPGLELALDLSTTVAPPADAHYGVFVETADDVERAIERLQNAGLASSVERDPEGRRWEVYTVHEDTDERDGACGCACA